MASLQIARQLISEGNQIAASEVLEAVVRENPQNIEALRLLHSLEASDRQIVVLEASPDIDRLSLPITSNNDPDGIEEMTKAISNTMNRFIGIFLSASIVVTVITLGLYLSGKDAGLIIDIDWKTFEAALFSLVNNHVTLTILSLAAFMCLIYFIKIAITVGEAFFDLFSEILPH